MRAVDADDRAGIEALHAAGTLAPLLGAHKPDDDRRRTPLMLAYWYGKAKAAQALVNAGSDYQQPDAAGNSAAWYARHFGAGERQTQMNDAIEAGTRRLSMDRVIDQAKAEAPPPPPAGGGRRGDI